MSIEKNTIAQELYIFTQKLKEIEDTLPVIEWDFKEDEVTESLFMLDGAEISYSVDEFPHDERVEGEPVCLNDFDPEDLLPLEDHLRTFMYEVVPLEIGKSILNK